MYLSSFLMFAIISASMIPAREIDEALAKVERRQVNLSTGASATSDSSSPTGSDDPSSVTTTFTQSTQVTSQGSVIVESSTIVATPTVAETTLVVETTSTRTSTNAQGETTTFQETISSVATSSVPVSYSEFVTSSVSQVLETSVYEEGGSTITATRTSSTTVPVTTSAAVTGTALAQGGSGGSSGLSSTNKKIIGGVVGGIGGALVLGALAYTAWRIWGKKRNLHDDDLYDPNANAEKLSTSTEQNPNSPFKNTLDQYHNPGPVNTASNF